MWHGVVSYFSFIVKLKHSSTNTELSESRLEILSWQMISGPKNKGNSQSLASTLWKKDVWNNGRGGEIPKRPSGCKDLPDPAFP